MFYRQQAADFEGIYVRKTGSTLHSYAGLSLWNCMCFTYSAKHILCKELLWINQRKGLWATLLFNKDAEGWQIPTNTPPEGHIASKPQCCSKGTWAMKIVAWKILLELGVAHFAPLPSLLVLCLANEGRGHFSPLLWWSCFLLLPPHSLPPASNPIWLSCQADGYLNQMHWCIGGGGRRRKFPLHG